MREFVIYFEIEQKKYSDQRIKRKTITWWDERGRVSQLDSCSALLRGWPSSDRQASEREDNDDEEEEVEEEEDATGTAAGSRRVGFGVGVGLRVASQPGFASQCPVFCSD